LHLPDLPDLPGAFLESSFLNGEKKMIFSLFLVQGGQGGQGGAREVIDVIKEIQGPFFQGDKYFF
jgi:hypothetical protein